MKKVSNLWDLTSGSGGQKAHHKAVRILIKKRHPSLYEGKKGAVLTAEQLDSIVAELSMGKSQLICSFRIKYLNSIIRKGIRTLSWVSPLATMPIVVKRAASPFTPKRFNGFGTGRRFESTFIRQLAIPVASVDGAIGQMLVSAVLFGGLLNPSLWAPWLKGASNFDGRSVAIARPSGDVRWIADPVTARLLQRMQREAPAALKMLEGDPWRYIKIGLSNVVYDDCRPSTSSQLRDWAEMRARLIMPPFLVDYALNSGPSVSLPDDVWNRILTGLPNSSVTPSLTGEVSPLVHLQVGKIGTPREAVPIIRELRNALRANGSGNKKPSPAKSAQMIKALMQTNGSLNSVVGLLLHWAHTRLTQAKGQGQLQNASILRYLTPLAGTLLAFAGAEDWSALDCDDILDLYLEVVEAQASDGDRVLAGIALANFHEVLLSVYPALRIDLSEVSAGSAVCTVEANLITPVEYAAAKIELRRLGDSWKDRMHLVVLILGYRAGVRRNEARLLTDRSIKVYGRLVDLEIRKTRHSGLKSASSTRRLPLDCLLDADELDFLLQWLADRPPYLSAAQAGFMFCDGDGNRVLSEVELFDPIQSALKRASGDNRSRFHHLRHSFATYLLLAMVLPNGADVSWLRGLDKFTLSDSRRNQLQNVLLGQNTGGRGILHAVSQALGHSGVKVTLGSYMHLADLLVWAYLSQAKVQPALGRMEKSILAAVTQSAVRVSEHRERKKQSRTKRNDPALRVDQATPTLDRHRDSPSRRIAGASLGTKLVSASPQAVLGAQERNANLPPMAFVERALEDMNNGRSVAQCVLRFGHTEADYDGWQKRSHQLRDMGTKKGGRRHRSSGRAFHEAKGHFPPAIAPGPERNDAMAMWDALGEYPVLDAPWRQGLQYFANRYCSTGSFVPLIGTSEIAAYRELAVSARIPKSRLTMRSTGTQPISVDVPSTARNPQPATFHAVILAATGNKASAAFCYVARLLFIVSE